MGWTSIFKVEEPKKTNIYQSDLFEDYLAQRGLRESSKETYRNYRQVFVEWLTKNEIDVPTTEDYKRYLIEKRNITNENQARARMNLFSAYCDWLVQTGRLASNPWDLIDADELKISPRFSRKPKEPIVPKKAFTLSEVAELLLAIEDGDDKAIAKILEGAKDGE